MCRWGWSHVLVSRFSLKHIKDSKHTLTCVLYTPPSHHPSPHPPPQSYELIKTLHLLKWSPKEALKDILNKCSLFNFDVCSPLNLTCKNTDWLLKCSCGDLIRWWTSTGGEPLYRLNNLWFIYSFIFCPANKLLTGSATKNSVVLIYIYNHFNSIKKIYF